ncbi:hypothetical protein GMOD_00010042 [Pyrenophora seminiperda CCB06]|uniref:Uncharacterized protein n=1 Tax=Pyrenophora seminiperda CCB06 TaxID=1302712 RepID=A0A3M7M1J5_9PLEO|nr:hypothetical protein GMOD_00010042 [Pyrenophora seminiperda CCB06]
MSSGREASISEEPVLFTLQETLRPGHLGADLQHRHKTAMQRPGSRQTPHQQQTSCYPPDLPQVPFVHSSIGNLVFIDPSTALLATLTRLLGLLAVFDVVGITRRLLLFVLGRKRNLFARFNVTVVGNRLLIFIVV